MVWLRKMILMKVTMSYWVFKFVEMEVFKKKWLIIIKSNSTGEVACDHILVSLYYYNYHIDNLVLRLIDVFCR